MKKKSISYDKFLEILSISNYMTCEEIIEMHKCLIDVRDSSKIHNGTFGEYYIYRLLEYNIGYNSPKEYQEYEKFFNSIYLSNYIKSLINRVFKNQSTIIKSAITSERNFAEFTEEEFYEIFRTALNIHTSESSSLCNLIVSYALHLNSVGATNFLNNRIDHTILIKKIILSSGLNSRPEFYCGRGVNFADLNSEHIISIYKKMEKIDKRKALNILKMTFNMPTLGATEFLESLYNLVYNNYEFDKSIISYNNFSLGNARNREREKTSISLFAASLLSPQRNLTASIKKQLKESLPKEIIEKIKMDKSYNDLEINGYSKKRKR